ncbi:hypothetical protein C7974DRAFT_283054, partial [Boeremia exigua]|uniref:uncharacterized protein n=1 Tax=Boeremia exigua TaxID=749465 RepID=UPI001E8D32B9
DWVAQVSLRGPILAEDFNLPTESGQANAESDPAEVRWQMLSLYTLPSHRSKGLGKKLYEEAFKYLQSRDQNQANPSKVVVRIMVKPDDKVTIKMYGSLGFVHTGVCTLEEALEANGDAELLPR